MRPGGGECSPFGIHKRFSEIRQVSEKLTVPRKLFRTRRKNLEQRGERPNNRCVVTVRNPRNCNERANLGVRTGPTVP